MNTARAAQAGLQGVQGHSPLLLLSHQIPKFPGAPMQSSLNNAQIAPSLDTNSSITAANKQKIVSPKTLKSQIPFHQI